MKSKKEKRHEFWLIIATLLMASFSFLLVGFGMYYNIKELSGLESSVNNWIDEQPSLKLHRLRKIDDNRAVAYYGKDCDKLEGLWAVSHCSHEAYVFVTRINGDWIVMENRFVVWER